VSDMRKRNARMYLAWALLAGFAVNCVFVCIAFYGGIVYPANLGEIILALAAVFSPHLSILFGAIAGDVDPPTMASRRSFGIALTSIAVWTLLLTARSAWFTSTAFTAKEDTFKNLIEFWGVVGGMGSLFVAGPLGFFIAKRDL
jgi:hypothetical protein